jgi:NADPH-dependent 2,4-dienoyl-CoA reductase/sulfur reductase-like enzyme
MRERRNLRESGNCGWSRGRRERRGALRRLDEHAEILMFEKGEYVSYANCGLPYYIGGVIEEEEKLLVQTPESFRNRHRIDVRLKSEVAKSTGRRKRWKFGNSRPAGHTRKHTTN